MSRVRQLPFLTWTFWSQFKNDEPMIIFGGFQFQKFVLDGWDETIEKAWFDYKLKVDAIILKQTRRMRGDKNRKNNQNFK